MLRLKRVLFVPIIFLGTLLCAQLISSPESLALFQSKNPKVYAPSNLDELVLFVRHAAAEHKKISVVGADKSQGGQTVVAADEGYRLSLHKLNKVVALKVNRRLATVQAGMTWCQLQKYLVPFGLAVKAMQSYNDFSIGGSLSVNCHGQDIVFAPLSKTVKSFKLLLATGDILTVSPTQNSELFRAELGGYGLLGIIVEVTLELTDDVILEKKITSINAESLADHFRNVINPNRAIQFYSARFSIGKSDLLNKVLVLTYERTDAVDPKLFEFKVGASSYLQKIGWLGIEKTEWVKNIRYFLEKNWFELPEKISRNNFMGYTVNSLPQDTAQSSYILQEYFIPYGCLNEFITHLRSMVERYGINLLNVTARHVPADKQTLLTYAPEDACALVLYIQLDRSERIYDQALVWTRSLIEKALEFSGTYYLPYHLIATQDQLQHAYPHFKDFLELKKIYDPHGIFSNKLYSKYFTINSCY